MYFNNSDAYLIVALFSSTCLLGLGNGRGVATPLWGKCEDETHTPKSENVESSGTLATSEFNCRGQNTSP
jgi:hypothetical protein